VEVPEGENQRLAFEGIRNGTARIDTACNIHVASIGVANRHRAAHVHNSDDRTGSAHERRSPSLSRCRRASYGGPVGWVAERARHGPVPYGQKWSLRDPPTMQTPRAARSCSPSQSAGWDFRAAGCMVDT
jgi:hypothetical protein